jgi:hypothetical protein
MMKVKVFHATVPVAQFDFQEAESINEALELAYEHTNNIRDSWSLAGSADAHPSLQLLKPRPIHDGQEYGHRSSMVGDTMEVTDIDGSDSVQTYVVASFGFDRIS